MGPFWLLRADRHTIFWSPLHRRFLKLGALRLQIVRKKGKFCPIFTLSPDLKQLGCLKLAKNIRNGKNIIFWIDMDVQKKFNSKYIFFSRSIWKNIFFEKSKKCRKLIKVLKINENSYMNFHWFLVLLSIFYIFLIFQKIYFFKSTWRKKYIWSWIFFGHPYRFRKLCSFHFWCF